MEDLQDPQRCLLTFTNHFRIDLDRIVAVTSCYNIDGFTSLRIVGSGSCYNHNPLG